MEIQFDSNGGSGLAGTVSRDDVVQAKDSVLSWLAQLGY